MAYREPGAYTNIINTRPLSGSLPNLTALIIGEGPRFIDFTGKAVVRGSTGLSDVLPSSKVTAINRVYTVSNGVETVIPATGNYGIADPNIITWESDSSAKPPEGATYYVDYEARPEIQQYQANYFSGFDQLNSMYGGMLMKTVSGGPAITVNPVYMGAYLALESGAQGAYVIQIEPADKTNYGVVVATDILTALDKAVALQDAYFIVPMTSNSTAINAVINHCSNMSTPLERKERVCFVSLGVGDPASPTGIFTDNEVAAAAELVKVFGDKRVRIPFVTKATKVLSDGTEYSLPGEYVCAAMAGLAAVIPVSSALTRQKLYNFTELKHVATLKRSSKNTLAEAGFIVLDQSGIGSPITIRHGLTTKTDNVADREHSIVVSMDYTAKYVRRSLEGYIGKYNIDSFLTTKVSGTLTGCKTTLVNNNVIRDLKIGKIAQATDSPDTLLIGLRANPLYPCNYIDLDILVE